MNLLRGGSTIEQQVAPMTLSVPVVAVPLIPCYVPLKKLLTTCYSESRADMSSHQANSKNLNPPRAFRVIGKVTSALVEPTVAGGAAATTEGRRS